MQMICYLCYNDEGPGSAALVRAVSEQVGTMLVRPAVPSGKAGLQATMPGGVVTLMAMPAPYPAGELTDDLAQRQAWPTWKVDSRRWRSHIVAVAIGSGNTFEARREHARNLLQIVSAVAAHTGPSAVGWSPNMLFHPATSFAAQVSEAPIPIECVVRAQWWQQPDLKGKGLALRTSGLGAFGLPEIDYPPSGESPEAIYSRVMNLSSYMLDQGPVLNDGDTIELDTEASMRIRHTQDANGGPLVSLLPVG